MIDPIPMFKYLLLKSIYGLSDVVVGERSKYDMSFKYFPNMASEEAVMEPSSLRKLRKLRLKVEKERYKIEAENSELKLRHGYK